MKARIAGFALIALAAFFADAAPAAALESPESVRRFEDLKVGSVSVPVRDITLTSGHAVLTLKSGSVTPVRAGDEVVGLYFEGAGALEYTTADSIELPVVEFETRKLTGITPEKNAGGILLRNAFDRMLWLSAGRPFPELPGGSAMWKPAENQVVDSVSAGPSLEASFRKMREKFSRIREAPVSHAFALQCANAPAEPLVVAEMEGGKGDLEYVLDGFDRRSEALIALRHPEGGDSDWRRGLNPHLLSEQPLERDRRDPLPPGYVLSDVRVDLTASDGKDASLVVHETIVPQRRAMSMVQFALQNTSFNQTGAGGMDRRTHRLRSVRTDAGKELSFHHDNSDLVVELDAPAAAGTALKLRFEIEGDYLIRPGGDNYWLLGTSAWFPQPDLAGQYYTFHARVKVKKPFIAFAPGKVISRGSDGDSNVVETDIDKPVQFAVILAGKYEFEEETRNGITVRVASYAGKNDRAIKQLTNLAFGIIEYYQNFLGPFPFPEFNILEINEYGFGQAPPAVMFITKEAFQPYIGEENQLFSGGVNERFAHEIAHQYWGHVVKMPSDEEQWLTESFAEYSAAIFLRQFKGKSTYQNLVANWKRRAGAATQAAPIALANRISIPSDFREAFRIRTGLLYDKGPYLLAKLEEQLGPEQFLTFLKSYQKSFRWKFGSTKHAAGLLQFMTKKDWMPFFDRYYWGTEMP